MLVVLGIAVAGIGTVVVAVEMAAESMPAEEGTLVVADKLAAVHSPVVEGNPVVVEVDLGTVALE